MRDFKIHGTTNNVKEASGVCGSEPACNRVVTEPRFGRTFTIVSRSKTPSATSLLVIVASCVRPSSNEAIDIIGGCDVRGYRWV